MPRRRGMWSDAYDELVRLTEEAEAKAREMRDADVRWVGLTHHACAEAAWAARRDRDSYAESVSAGDCL